MVDLVIVGSVGIDSIATPVESRKDIIGGAASYASAASSFFAKTGVVAVVGDDFRKSDDECLAGFGIDTAGLERTKGPTFRWSCKYDDDFINRTTLSTELGVFAEFSPKLPESYRGVKHLFLGNIGPELQLHMLDQAKDAEFTAVDTMDLWINIAKDKLMEVISRVNFLTLNDGEARLLTGKRNLVDCAETLLAAGPDFVAIKKGEHGSLVFAKDGRIFVLPAYLIRSVTDPTGAGDMFAGACMGYLAGRGGKVTAKDIVNGLLYGSVVASFGVENFGVSALTGLTRARIDARLAELRVMANLKD